MFDSLVCVETDVLGCPSPRMIALSVWNVATRVFITEPFSQTKINYIHQIALHQEISRFDVTMKEIFAMYVFYPADLQQKTSKFEFPA